MSPQWLVPEHDRKAQDSEGHRGNEEIEEVLLRDIDTVLGAHRPGFEQEKPCLHEEHEPRSRHCPDVVEVLLKCEPICLSSRRVRQERETGGKNEKGPHRGKLRATRK